MSTRSQWLIDKSEAVSRGAMVTAMHPLAADVGAQILERGGSAIDAAIATAFAIGVVEPFMSGVGGIAFLVYRDAATGETVCFDGSSVLPAAIRPEMFELLDPTSGPACTCGGPPGTTRTIPAGCRPRCRACRR